MKGKHRKMVAIADNNNFKVNLTQRQSLAWRSLAVPVDSEVCYGGAKGGGKATSLNALLYTPHGSKKMCDIKIGDLVACQDGSFSPVIAVYPQGVQKLYRVTFLDGRNILTTADHLWYAKIVGRKNKHDREWSIYTTGELINYVNKAKKTKSTVTPNVLVPLCEKIQFTITSRYLRYKIDPYILGLLIGDGCLTSCSTVTFSSNDKHIIQSVQKKYPVKKYKDKYTYGIPDGGILKKELTVLGLYGHRAETKFIPQKYKLSPIEIRKAVIQGLFDTDGYIDKRGHVQFVSVSKQLAEDVQWVIRSLGGKATLTSKIGQYRDVKCQRVYMLYINIKNPYELFQLPRKKNRGNISYNGGNGNLCNRIISIKYEKDDFAQCITIRDPKGLYVTEDFIVTHNSYFGCVWSYAKALEIIEKCGITEELEYPLPIGFLGRKQAKDFRETTLETWKKTIPPSAYQIKGNPAEIIIQNRVKILTGGLDRTESINKFSSAEFFFFFIDQAEETTRDDISVLRGSLRAKYNGRYVPYKGLFTANPANCWLKDEFILKPTQTRQFVQALPSDNPYLPESYINTLKNAFGHRQQLLEAYLYGSWNLSDDVDQIIKAIWIEWARNISTGKFKSKKRRYLTCDVARFGDDETVIYYMEDTDIVEDLIYGQKDTMYTANRLSVMSRNHNECPIIVDESNMGGGVVDRLVELGHYVIAANSASASTQQEKYYNKRAEIYDNAGRMFAEKDVELHHVDPVLETQLCTPKYKFRNSKILVEPKEDIKDRLGRSPDRADAYVNGLYFGKQVTETEEDGSYSKSANYGVYIPDFIGVV